MIYRVGMAASQATFYFSSTRLLSRVLTCPEVDFVLMSGSSHVFGNQPLTCLSPSSLQE